MTVVDSFCRICNNNCAIRVTVTDGVVTKVSGNSDDPVYRGYTCVKGRSQHQYLTSPERLLHSLKRGRAGVFEPISHADAIAEIAERLTAVVDAHGPGAVAAYAGTMALASFSTAMPFFDGLLDAIGTRLRFDPNTLDKGGKQIAQAFLGRWNAPSQGFDDPRAILLIGINPLVTYTGFPAGSPHTWLADVMAAGCSLVVIDPRRTEVAAKATLHLAPRPGHDVELLAAMVRVVLDEDLHDADFVAAHVANVDALRRAVAPFTPELVGARADVAAADIVRAARIYASAPRGYAMAGTGPNMAGNGSLLEYLVLVLETLCGRWLREGETVRQAATVLPMPQDFRAGTRGPYAWQTGEVLGTRGLARTRAGLPLAALSDEILAEGPGRIRALICWGGNPMVAFPDQSKTARALEALDLLVCIDPWMTATARYADYVIAPTMPLETAAVTSLQDMLSLRATGYGYAASYAHYTPAVVDAPGGSDVIEDWRFFHDLTVALGHPVQVRPPAAGHRVAARRLDSAPTTAGLLELFSEGSRIPFATVRAQGGGALHPDPGVMVGPSGPDDLGRLDVGSREMLDLLATYDVAAASPSAGGFHLLCRRNNHTYNTSCNVPATNRGVSYNPAYLHPADMAALGLADGELVAIRSAHDEVVAVAAADTDLRRETVSMAFGYGPSSGGSEVLAVGTSPNRIIANDIDFDRYTGQPKMSAVPVEIVPLRGRG